MSKLITNPKESKKKEISTYSFPFFTLIFLFLCFFSFIFYKKLLLVSSDEVQVLEKNSGEVVLSSPGERFDLNVIKEGSIEKIKIKNVFLHKSVQAELKNGGNINIIVGLNYDVIDVPKYYKNIKSNKEDGNIKLSIVKAMKPESVKHSAQELVNHREALEIKQLDEFKKIIDDEYGISIKAIKYFTNEEIRNHQINEAVKKASWGGGLQLLSTVDP